MITWPFRVNNLLLLMVLNACITLLKNITFLAPASADPESADLMQATSIVFSR